jgi:HlyD family secretion protein
VNRLAALFLAMAALASCRGAGEQQLPIQTEPVARRDIIVDASATGAVEPINVIEVKSKSSGLITQMTVETGSLVTPGQLLVQLDTRDVQAQYDQAEADLKAAESRLSVAESQRKRSDELYKGKIITAQEFETTALDYANAQAQLVRSRASLDIAKQRLDDATVTAPVAGTVIEKTVSLGQVITSATSSASGGTTILKMADLGQVRVRALVNESDIGQIRAGLPATVVVDAYPDRPFQGSVEKIEPQAVVQQSVTMFPVLVSLSNEEGLLKPGMNGEISVLIERRESVLTVSNDAIRSMREAMTSATALGLDPDSVQAQLRGQMRGGMMNGGAEPGAQPRVSRGEVALSADRQGEGRGQGQRGARGQGQSPEVTAEQCAAVTAAFAKKPDAQQKLDALRERVRSGEIDFQAMRTESQKIYADVGVDARTAGACRMRNSDRARGPAGAGAANGAAPQGQPGAAASAPVAQGEFPMRTRSRSGLVFVAENGTWSPRVVRLGVSNFDYTEVLSGLKEGEEVALLNVVALQAERDARNERFRGMAGGGVPGMSRTGGTGGGAGRGR